FSYVVHLLVHSFPTRRSSDLKSFAQVHGLSYLAVIKDITEVAIEPSLMGISPIKAINQLLQRNEMTIKDIDLFEINEAFAATSRSEEHTSELQSRFDLVCRLL